jgi:hypothetical protein
MAWSATTSRACRDLARAHGFAGSFLGADMIHAELCRQTGRTQEAQALHELHRQARDFEAARIAVARADQQGRNCVRAAQLSRTGR